MTKRPVALPAERVVGGRVARALRDMTSEVSSGCCKIDGMCPRHDRIDAHVKYARANHDYLMAVKRDPPDVVEALLAAVKTANDRYLTAVAVERVAEQGGQTL